MSLNGFCCRFVIASVLVLVALATVPAPAAAHDPGCVVSYHVGPAKDHVQCDERNRGDLSNCLLSVNVGPAHKDIQCG